jgi:hypothetical protein
LESVLARNHGANLTRRKEQDEKLPTGLSWVKTGYNIMKCDELRNELNTEIFGTTDFIEQNLSLQADRSSSSQDFPRIVRKTKARCRLQKCATSVIILSQINPFHDRSSYFFEVLFYYYSTIYANVFQEFFSFRFSYQNPVCIFHPLPTTNPTNLAANFGLAEQFSFVKNIVQLKDSFNK